ncbi:hypothetical protein Golob_006624, partial [Gossypium lobatum]|nr:hypothetical protein [Gossypium lobatum]
MGVSIRPEAMAWPWICLSWSMDLLDSIRENGGSSYHHGLEGVAPARHQTWVYTVARYHSTTSPPVLVASDAPAGNRTRVCTVAGYYSTTRPLVLLGSASTARFVPPDLIIQEEVTVSCKMGVLVRPELYGSAVDLFELVHGFAEGIKRSSEALLLSSEDRIIAKNPCLRKSAEIITARAMHQPGIEPGSVPWQVTFGHCVPKEDSFRLGNLIEHCEYMVHVTKFIHTRGNNRVNGKWEFLLGLGSDFAR